MFARSPTPTLLLFAFLLPIAAGCTAGGYLDRHFDGRRWTEALADQARAPDQLLIELGLLTATVGLAPFDHRLQEEATENQPITEGSTNNGDGTATGLALLATGAAVADWIGGDDAHALEVLGESFAVTEGLTEILKAVVGRQRPSKDSNSSFPSGHTSFAFAMATYLQRRVADSYDGWVGDLGYLAYLPAAYVGQNRVEANRHWPSDVAFGAFLGVLLTNVVYDAHYGSAAHPGLFGVRNLALEPTLPRDPDDQLASGAGLSLVLRF